MWTPVAGLVGAVIGAVLLQIGAPFAGSFVRGGLRLTPLRVIDSAGGLLLGVAIGARDRLGRRLGRAPHAAARRRLPPGRPALGDRASSSTPPCRRGRSSTSSRASIRSRRSSADGAVAAAAAGRPARPRRSARHAPASSRCSARRAGSGVEGSGWFARRRPRRHRGACRRRRAATRSSVIPGEPLQHAATSSCFDVHNDIAVLRVSGATRDAAAARGPAAGSARSRSLGYPLDGGPRRRPPAGIGPTATVFTQDALGHGPVERGRSPPSPDRSSTATPAGRRSTRAGSGRVDDLRRAARLRERLRRPAVDHPQRPRARRHARRVHRACAP